MSISANFNMFCNQLEISAKKKSVISLRYNSISKKLNNDFWNINTNYGGIYAGCYGRETAIDGVKEIDMIFEMPSNLLSVYDACGGKCQARFLEDVCRSIKALYPKTIIDREKQIIKVRFSDGMYFNVLPAFIKDDGDYIFADLIGEGSWNIKKPIHLVEAVKQMDKATSQTLTKLCKMTKAWKRSCRVKIKDVLIDTLAYEFLLSTKKKYELYSSFDIMCKDFFEFLMNQEPSKTIWKGVGGSQEIYNSENFRYKAILAHFKAENAIKLEEVGRKWKARQKWKEIFGSKFPESVKVELQIKNLYDKAVALYNTQKKCARILNQKVLTFKGLQIVTALLIISGMLIIGYTEKFDLGLGIFMISSVMFLVILYFKKYNLGNISLKHKQSALRILLIKEEFKSLLKDLNSSDVDIATIKGRKEELKKKMFNMYRGTSKSVSKKYSRAIEKIQITSKVKESLPTIDSEKMQIPVWQNNEFYMENKIQSLMNYKN